MFRIVYCRLLVYNGSYNTDDWGIYDMKRKGYKRYGIKKGTTIIMIILMVLCLLVQFVCGLSIHDDMSAEKMAIYKTIKDVLLVIVSVTGVNLFSSMLIEVNCKNNYLSDIMNNDIISSPEFYNNMSEINKTKVCDALERSLFFNYEITHEMYKCIRNKLKENLGEYYYTKCSYSVTCSIYDNYIEKEVTRITRIRSYENTQKQKRFHISSFCSKKIDGFKQYEIKSLEINGRKIKKDDIDEIITENQGSLDEQNGYEYFVEYFYKKVLCLNYKQDTVITLKYITRTTNDDRMSTFRVGCPCKNFDLFYTIKQPGNYRIAVSAYGFLDDADSSSTNTSSPSDITITFNDWIYKFDGVTVVMFDK